MVEKEVLNIELEWFRFNVNGKEERYFKIELKDAQLLSINQMMPEIGDKRSEQLRLMESIIIAYSEITWSWGPFGDIAYQTNWRGER
jgi:type VI secretion system secreted protein Hcp